MVTYVGPRRVGDEIPDRGGSVPVEDRRPLRPDTTGVDPWGWDRFLFGPGVDPGSFVQGSCTESHETVDESRGQLEQASLLGKERGKCRSLCTEARKTRDQGYQPSMSLGHPGVQVTSRVGRVTTGPED